MKNTSHIIPEPETRKSPALIATWNGTFRKALSSQRPYLKRYLGPLMPQSTSFEEPRGRPGAINFGWTPRKVEREVWFDWLVGLSSKSTTKKIGWRKWRGRPFLFWTRCPRCPGSSATGQEGLAPKPSMTQWKNLVGFFCMFTMVKFGINPLKIIKILKIK